MKDGEYPEVEEVESQAVINNRVRANQAPIIGNTGAFKAHHPSVRMAFTYSLLLLPELELAALVKNVRVAHVAFN